MRSELPGDDSRTSSATLEAPTFAGHISQLPTLKADLVLLHAPAFFDFRNRRDIYFPFLGTSGDVPITPLYEYFPVGFKTLQRYLGNAGHEVRIINLSSLLLHSPQLDFDEVLRALDTRIIGIDLHWMVHVQGSLAVAKRIRQVRPDVLVMFGGISASYFADQLIRYPYVDLVMRGYNTHEPVAALLRALKTTQSLTHVPNLLWKDVDSTVRKNEFSHKPNEYGYGIDWSQLPAKNADAKSGGILELLSTQNAGCSNNCGWCGGSSKAFRRIYGRQRTIVRKPVEQVAYEFETINRIPNVGQYHFYSVGSYNESVQGMRGFLDLVAQSQLKSISYEQFFLTSDEVLKHMARANKRSVITLSPESHDIMVGKLAGRGVYTNDEMEAWLQRALDAGIYGIDIWYFVGMPGQNPDSVAATVDYCEHLLEKFKGTNVNPMLCPMIPFLDPASTFFESPREHGYRVFYRTVEDHRVGMERASILNRINYETDWLSRRQLVDVGFSAVRRLMQAKGEIGALPKGLVREYNAQVDDALEFIPIVHAVDEIQDDAIRRRELDCLGDEILRRNELVLFGGVMNQAYPLNRRIGGRWFDELGWDASALAGLQYAKDSSIG